MKKLLNYLNSPYPVFYQRWKIAVISSVIVFLILAIGNWLYSAIVFNWGFRLDIFYNYSLSV
ncbi:hypothetical protein [Bacteroides nordii]|uniref:hypothetical protein n=1 Tax=Bacteroides nordii TaxID=291645 RepID=UPI002A804C93|nr:hypothetical protein [Bacteroides nordii]